MFVMPLGIVIVVSAVQPENSELAIPVALWEKEMFVSEVQLENTPLPATLLGMAMLARAVQPANAESPRLVPVLGSVIPVRLAQLNHALLPMPPTRSPLMVPGMTTVPPGPTYPVMVIAPPL